MLLISLALLGADLGSAVPMEQRVASLETRMAAAEARLGMTAAAAPGTCPCGPNCPCANQATTTTIRHADGSLWTRTCGPDGCRETRADFTPATTLTAVPCATCPGGVRWVETAAGGAFAQPPSFATDGRAGAGGCANGQCGGGSRGTGGVVGVGGRVLFGRRR